MPARLQALLDAFDEPALIIAGGSVVLANRTARAILGRGIEGKDIRLVIRHPRALEHLLGGTAGDCEVSGIGDFERPWLLSIRETGDGAVLVRLIDRAAEVATERMRVDFVANASHELRTPLSTILGYAETLAEDPALEPELTRRFAGSIRREAKRMVSLIEDLMNLSRIEAGRFVTPSEAVPVESFVRTAVANLKTVGGAEDCQIEVLIPDGTPAVRGDRAQLMQMLDNLLTNALRYGCTAKRKAIRIEAAVEGSWVRLVVSDQGPGIPREHLPRVTERFYRVDAARSSESGGTGLGLAIVKHIVERHRGSLDIRSEQGQGTEVIVRLPRANR